MANRSRSIAAIKRNRTARLASLATRAYYLHRRHQEERMYTLICDEFVSFGGVYVKFLQGVLLQSSVFEKWQNADRLKVFENLDHEPIDILRLLRHELPPEKLAKIKFVQPQPFAAGSFGQVYYGEHVDGNPIILKVLRPMVRELLRYDLRLLGVFSKSFVGHLSPNMEVRLDEAIKDFRVATLKETDYVAEATFADELYHAYKDHPKFIIPKTYLELCTSNIIVQEYVSGISVAQVIRMKSQGVDAASYVKEQLGSDLDTQLITLGVELLDGVFNLPRIQGDPHPGNVRLLEDNKVALIDFGISAPTPRKKADFFGLIDGFNDIYAKSSGDDLINLFEQFLRFFVGDLYRALRKLSSAATTTVTQENLTRTIGKLAQDMFHQQTGPIDFRSLFESGKILDTVNQTINRNNRFGLIVHLESSEVLRAMQTYMTLVKSLEMRNVVLPVVFAETVRREDIQHPEFRGQSEDTMSWQHAYDIVSRWLERVANKDPILFRQLMSQIRMKRKKVGSKHV